MTTMPTDPLATGVINFIDSPKTLANRLILARVDQGFNQKMLAEALATTQSHVSDLESAIKNPGLETVLAWAASLGFRLALVPMDRHPFEDEVVEIRVQ